MNPDHVTRLMAGEHKESPAELYHENSKSRRLSGPGGVSREALEVMHHGFKRYGESPIIDLPAPVQNASMGLSEAIRRRRSVRDFADKPVSAEAFSTLLFSAYGHLSPSAIHRTVPSGGGLYPLEIYLVALRDLPFPEGAYHYDVRGHRLEVIPRYRHPSAIRGTIFVPEAAATAQAFLVVSAVFGRSRIKYGEKCYRFALLEAGHVGQNLALMAAALGVGFCPFGGFVDDDVNDLLGLDGVDEAALYLGGIGAVPS